MSRISWSDTNLRKLLNIIVKEKNKGVSKYNWANIAKIFNAQTGFSAAGKEVRNHYTDMKEKYKCWEELQSLTGISYDPKTGELDVAEKSLERYKAFLECNTKYGKKKDQSYLAKNTKDLTVGEGHGDIELNEEDGYCMYLSDDENKSLPRSAFQNEPQPSSLKRKSEVIVDGDELKRRQTSFDSVIKLLSTSCGSSRGPSKSQMVSEELVRMEIAEKYDDECFVMAIST
ncbi:hypothetical protein RND81_07G125500 [Saponaria officinalis]|uniref:Myb/SANT-like domain-containing protein n=1 Tax=Saponaria officinalis TaxID=3572 RepID=A0AAW1JU94_SAPOF